VLVSRIPPFREHGQRLGWYHGRGEERRVEILFSEPPYAPSGARESISLKFSSADPQQKGTSFHFEIGGCLTCC
jgi:hypothetical protein